MDGAGGTDHNLLQELNHMRDALHDLERRHQMLAQQDSEHLESLRDMAAEIDNLGEDLERLYEKLHLHQREVEEFNRKYVRAQEVVDRDKSDIETLERELRRLNRNCETAQARAARCSRDLTTVRRRWVP